MVTPERDEVREPTAQIGAGPAQTPADSPVTVRPPRRRLVVGAIAAGAVLVLATAAAANALKPDLAAMPPVMRDPGFPTAPGSEPGAPALTVSASTAASATATPSPTPTPTASGSAAPSTSNAARATQPRLVLSSEAESAQRRGGNVRSVAAASGGKVVEGLDRSGDHVQFSVTPPAAGRYTLVFHYISGSGSRKALVRVNSGQLTTVTFSSTGNWQTVRSLAVTLDLTAGGNDIMFAAGATPAPDLDRISVWN